jgi:D-glucuronyl C5-epimerase-like protein
MRKAYCGCLAVVAALAWAAPAGAAEILMLGEDGRVRAVEDRALPEPAAMPAPPRRAVSARRPAAGATTAQRRKRRTVAGELRRLMRRGAIPAEDYASRRAAYEDARRRTRRLSGTREREMRAVLATLREIAARRQLTPSRLVPLWLTLERNLEWWTTGKLLGSGQRIGFEGSELVWQYYPGEGIQLQMLGNFGKLNGLWSSRAKTRMAAMVDELAPLAVERAGGVAWEYYFTFNGGAPPWVSGMAQGTAVQALARTATRLGREADLLPLAQRALAIFGAPTPQGVRVPGKQGDHYVLYSFAPRFRVINGFAQALVGLFDYATLSGDPRGLKLFEAGDREARRELPAFDTGAWSLYSRGSITRESDLGYHDLLRGFLRNLCRRTAADVYCSTADRFLEYKAQPPVIDVREKTLRGGRDGRVRFTLSKISSVSLRITRGDSVVEARPFGNVGYGSRSFAWDDVPRRAGEYTVELSATDLTGNTASDSATVRVLRPKRGRRS